MTKRYDTLIARYQKQYEEKNRRFHLLGYAKLALLAAVVLALYRCWATGWPTALSVTAAVLLVTLIILWVYHIRVHDQLRHCQAVLDAAGRYLDRIAGRWGAFTDDGGDFADAEHPYSADLDIVGKRSLFQLLNVAHTFHGRRRFAADLLDPHCTAQEIAGRQQAVEELSRDPEFAVLLECATEKTGGDASVQALAETLRTPAGGLPALASALLLWLPPLVAAFSAIAMTAGNPGMRILAGILCTAQGVFWAGGYGRTSRALSAVLSAPHIFGHYAAAMQRVAGQQFTAPLLADIRDELAGAPDGPIAAMDKLDTIVGNVRLKHNGLFYFLANVFLLWDYRCLINLERWKLRHGPQCEGWFERLGELESLLSLSVLGNVCPGTCLPEVVRQPGVFRAAQLGHPLLPAGSRVCNDVDIDGQLLIISGSNMSGKTTFLRTMGVNLVLARAGGRVCASSLQTALFYLRTSLRVADDLGEGVSTFYAELRQVAAIIRDARERDDLFFLIDELFRGTNSEDRLFGGRAAIEELARLPAVGAVTTHDLSLCDLDKAHPSIRNYSFSEEYRGDQMLFSYKMQPGRARTTNARFLMRQIGIL